MNDKSKKIYLGGIDPNIVMASAENVRIGLMLRLLMWDKIVLSDSQIITDPRIRAMMSKYDSKEKIKDLDKDQLVLRKEQRGIETLLKAGLIEVAKRKQGGNALSLEDVWQKMNNRPKELGEVPFLPKEESYAQYLDSLSLHTIDYDLMSIGKRFKNNLQQGTTISLFRKKRDKKGRLFVGQLKEMFNQNEVLFSTIKSFLEEGKNSGNITEEDYAKFYNYVYSCYSPNISAETGCFIDTRVKYVPFHLDAGIGDFKDELKDVRKDLLRKSWVFNPVVFNHLDFQDIVDIRREVEGKYIKPGLFIKFLSGRIKANEWKEFKDYWEEYVNDLKNIIKDMLNEEIWCEIGDQQKEIDEKELRKSQITVNKYGIEWVISFLAPGLSPGFENLPPAQQTVLTLISLVPIFLSIHGFYSDAIRTDSPQLGGLASLGIPNGDLHIVTTYSDSVKNAAVAEQNFSRQVFSDRLVLPGASY